MNVDASTQFAPDVVRYAILRWMTLHNPAIHFHQFANLFQLNEYLPAEKAEDFEFETKKAIQLNCYSIPGSKLQAKQNIFI